MTFALLKSVSKRLNRKLWLQIKNLQPSNSNWYSPTKGVLSSFSSSSQQSSLTYCKTAHAYNSFKQSVVHDLCSDIDIEQIKADLKNNKSTQTSRLEDVVAEQIQQRLDEAIKGFNGAELRHLKILQLEHEFLYSEGYAIPAPETLTSRNWLEVMTMTNTGDRLLYFTNLERNATKFKRQPAATHEEGCGLGLEDGDDEYCENSSSIFGMSLSPEQEERLANYRLASAMVHGDPLVVDMGFDENHLSTEIDPLVEQLWNLYLVNRNHRDPLHLVFTNCNFQGPTYRHMLLHCMVKVDFVMATFTEENYTDIFCKEDLVYLSAQAKQYLPALNSSCVYILGAYYDPMVHKKLSFVKAQEEKIRCVKLPIDQHVKWAHQAHKDLDLDNVGRLLLAVRSHGQWKKAFLSEVPHLINRVLDK